MNSKQLKQGCEYCNNPMYCGIKCKNCGLAQPKEPEQEPVARVLSHKEMAEAAKRYTTPPQRKPLTDEQIEAILYSLEAVTGLGFASAIEAAHGIKGD